VISGKSCSGKAETPGRRVKKSSIQMVIIYLSRLAITESRPKKVEQAISSKKHLLKVMSALKQEKEKMRNASL
jgi:hypothetical protein